MNFSTILKSAAAALLLLSAVPTSAQGLKIVAKNGATTIISYEDLDYVTTYEATHGDEPIGCNPAYVDLGLSVKWATFNVGATTPDEAGNYFMWASTVDDPEVKYNKLTTPYQDPTYADPDYYVEYFLKYCNTQDAGIPDYRTTLEAMDDAATAAWGSDWRMPTAEEMTELITNTTVTKLASDNTEYPGVAGYKFTGSNGNSIFIPAVGYRYLLGIYGNSGTSPDMLYWTSSLYTPSCLYANALAEKGYGANKTLAVDFKGRYMGYPVRPVYKY